MNMKGFGSSFLNWSFLFTRCLCSDLQLSRTCFYQCKQLFSQAEVACVMREDSKGGRQVAHTHLGAQTDSRCIPQSTQLQCATVARTWLFLNPGLRCWLFVYMKDNADKLVFLCQLK